MRDLSGLTDEELKARLLQHGFHPGPITATTRYVYEKKLRRLLEPKVLPQQNGSGDQAMYSDSEEEENEEEEEEEQLDPSLEAVAFAEKDTADSKPQVPVTDVLMEIFPETEKTPTGISASRRKPIKGAAGRPVQFKYPDTPLSPNSADQQEVQRRQVPLWVQLVIFLIVTLVLYVTYSAMEDSLENPLTLLLDGLNQAAEVIEGELAAPDVEDAPSVVDATTAASLSGE